MHSIFKDLTNNIEFTGNLKHDIHLFLTANNCSKTAVHCMEVGTEARRVALLFEANPDAAEIAGWLHDISVVFPNNERIAVSRDLQIEILLEEEAFPMIIHQKLSKVMAREIFGITDIEILDAVGCHTTLRAHSTLLDQVLFVADKISWDQLGEPPYIQELNRNLNISLTHGAFSYINFLWERKDTLKVIHPWLKEAYEEIKYKVSI
jgi:predicted HD superfamily hydrolase involved in NAD metabolism